MNIFFMMPFLVIHVQRTNLCFLIRHVDYCALHCLLDLIISVVLVHIR